MTCTSSAPSARPCGGNIDRKDESLPVAADVPEIPAEPVLRARATDLAERLQPQRAQWNRLGYDNANHHVPIEPA
jgi:hypothetical protein